MECELKDTDFTYDDTSILFSDLYPFLSIVIFINETSFDIAHLTCDLFFVFFIICFILFGSVLCTHVRPICLSIHKPSF